MSHDLTCRCGAMNWRVENPKAGSHLACYCADCQTAAQHLGAGDMLDDAGGTEIFQTLPSNLQITQGQDHLALMRLSPKGLFRWHAACCGTPIANTLPKPSVPFAGMVLPAGTQGFGPVTAHVQTKAARRPVREHGFAATGFAILRRAITARLSGNRQSPFFDAAGQPVAAPQVITQEQRSAARPK